MQFSVQVTGGVVQRCLCRKGWETYCQAIGPSGEQYFVQQEWFVLDRPGLKRGIPLGTDGRVLCFVSAFSPDGKLMAQGTEEGVVLVVDIEAVGQRLSALQR
jgi:hypothetical protein